VPLCTPQIPHGLTRDFFFFLPVRGFPFDPFFLLFKSFRPSCHFTFHATVLTSNTTQSYMPPVGFEPTILVSDRQQTHSLDRKATGIGNRTRVSAVRCRRLTAWAMARPSLMLRECLLIYHVFSEPCEWPRCING
jgi:hypothetical protein